MELKLHPVDISRRNHQRRGNNKNEAMNCYVIGLALGAALNFVYLSSYNMFRVGQKLEAVDRKNPHLICAASVGMNLLRDPVFLFHLIDFIPCLFNIIQVL